MANPITGFLGNAVDIFGSSLGLPEWGISERIASHPTTNTTISPINSGPGPSMFSGLGGSPLIINTRPQNQPNGQVQGTSTIGGGGGGNPNPDVNAGSDPNHLVVNGQDFGNNSAAYMDAVNQFRRQQELGPQVDAEYNSIFDNLNQQESAARGNYPNIEGQYTAGIDAQKPILDQAYQTGQQNVATQRGQEDQSNANVLAQVRRLFNELTQGVQQKYGGANSAGGFANEFYGREMARQQGTVQQTHGQNVQKLLDYGNQLKEKFDAQTQSLEKERAGAISQAKDVFQQRLDAINNARLGAQQNKAQLKLQALQEMRNQAFQIEQQYNAFNQQLIAQRQAADLNLRNAVQSYVQQAAAPVQTTQSSFTNPGSVGRNMSTLDGSQGGSSWPQQLTGSTGAATSQKSWLDQLLNR